MDKIDVRNNTARLITGKGVKLIPGRNSGVDKATFAAAFYGQDGLPTTASRKHFEAPYGGLPALQVLEPTNLSSLSLEDAASVLAEVNDRGLLENLLKEEKRPAIQALLKAQQEKLGKAVTSAAKEQEEEGKKGASSQGSGKK